MMNGKMKLFDYYLNNYAINLLPDEQKFELVVINPGYMIGPVLQGSNCTSMEVRVK